jgi:hypothetical protein
MLLNRIVPGGAEGNRTPDLVDANDALSHLSYNPAFRQAVQKQTATHTLYRILPTTNQTVFKAFL